jgi:hypothetical protein
VPGKLVGIVEVLQRALNARCDLALVGLAAALAVSLSVQAPPVSAQGTSNGGPIEVCGQTLWDSPVSPVQLTYARPGHFRLPMVLSRGPVPIILTFVNGCTRGAKVTTTSSVHVVARARTHDHLTAAVALQGGAGSSGTITAVRSRRSRTVVSMAIGP